MPNPSKDRGHPILVALGRSIRSLRRSQGLSQEELALLAGIDRSYLGRIERGENSVGMMTLMRLAAALGITIVQLIQMTGT